jgi:hypothetical protein
MSCAVNQMRQRKKGYGKERASCRRTIRDVRVDIKPVMQKKEIWAVVRIQYTKKTIRSWVAVCWSYSHVYAFVDTTGKAELMGEGWAVLEAVEISASLRDVLAPGVGGGRMSEPEPLGWTFPMYHDFQIRSQSWSRCMY